MQTIGSGTKTDKFFANPSLKGLRFCKWNKILYEGSNLSYYIETPCMIVRDKIVEQVCAQQQEMMSKEGCSPYYYTNLGVKSCSKAWANSFPTANKHNPEENRQRKRDIVFFWVSKSNLLPLQIWMGSKVGGVRNGWLEQGECRVRYPVFGGSSALNYDFSLCLQH